MLNEGINYFEFLHTKNTIRTVKKVIFLQIFINEKVNIVFPVIFYIVSPVNTEFLKGFGTKYPLGALGP